MHSLIWMSGYNLMRTLMVIGTFFCMLWKSDGKFINKIIEIANWIVTNWFENWLQKSNRFFPNCLLCFVFIINWLIEQENLTKPNKQLPELEKKIASKFPLNRVKYWWRFSVYWHRWNVCFMPFNSYIILHWIESNQK